MTPGHCSRAVRAAMFAALCVVLAATGHVLMSGTPLPGWALAGAFAGASALAWSLAGTERGLRAVTTVAVAVQAALHAGFSLVQSLTRPLPAGRSFAEQWAQYLTCGDTRMSPSEAARLVDDAGLGGMVHQPPPGTASLADAGAHAHHALHGMPDAMQGAPGIPGAAVPDAHAMAGMSTSASGMLAAHLLAAVVAGLWLAYGEQAAFRLLRTFTAWLWTPLRLLLAPSPVPHRPPPRARRRRDHSPLRQLFLIDVITSRGPPPGTAVI
ncbi:hypothetical protein AB0469_29245 [Streptomyces sp. NPDC093801]|uniref:hypothetical protein n=1 Tax=Streptomyces sp. NPDC093801 TaxID=3155203 RepID=UPI00344E1EE5